MLRPVDRPRHGLAKASNNRQQGVVLLVALIVLVALTLAGVALVRSVDTANLVAGNLSFHQSAIQAGERSTELALTSWLHTPSSTTLHSNDPNNNFYFADGTNPTPADGIPRSPAPGQSWDAYWTNDLVLAGSVTPRSFDINTGTVKYTVRYVIHRLCESTNAPHLANCAREPASTNTGGSQAAGGLAPIGNNRVYYRITTRIEGPRRTVAYIQTIVAL
ncbi:MAG: hypothetical protein J5X21_01880 [Candidatus Accumulibacter sp.]|jgi:type IV pilus assembly protein PilX|nr:hypothetical protein [Candidatus Accumulibacter conexus]